MSPYVEQYFKIVYYRDIVAPLCIVIAVIVAAGLLYLATRIAKRWEERQKKMADKFWRIKNDGHDE